MKDMDFKGIVRNVSAQNNTDGNCEEVINMRFEDGVWRTIGEKKQIVPNDSFLDVFVHTFDGADIYLAKIRENGGYSYRRFDIGTGEIVAGKRGIPTTAGGYLVGNQNFLIATGSTKAMYLFDYNTDEYEQINNLPLPLFTFVKESRTNPGSGVYQKTLTNIRPADFHAGTWFEETNEPDLDDRRGDTKEEWANMTFDRGELQDLNEFLVGVYRSVADRNRNYGYVQGNVFVCAAFELFDGSVINYTPPVVVSLGEEAKRNLFLCSEQDYEDEGDVAEGNMNVAKMLLSFCAREMLVENLKIRPSVAFESHKNVIKRMNIYMSDVVDKYDTEKADSQYMYFVWEGKKYNLLHTNENKDALPARKIDGELVDGIQFYRILQFNPGESDYKEVSFENVTTNPTMPVDSCGWFEKTGNMFLYNQRVHLFNYTNVFLFPNLDLNPVWQKSVGAYLEIFAYIKTGVEDIITRHTASMIVINQILFLPTVLSFPDSRAYKLVFRWNDGRQYLQWVVYLKASNTNNFAFAHQTMVQGEASSLPFAPVTPKYTYLNKDNMIVYEANNPMYHSAANSYRVNGYILNVAVATEQISGSQVGQYPLYVFTSEGIYAVQTGDGNILYSNVVPVSAEVAVEASKILQTKYGIVFVTVSGLKLISGREVASLSDPVDGVPDGNIRRNGDFCSLTSHPQLYDIAPCLSRIPFVEYIRRSEMGYDLLKDELIVSNTDYDYSYVLNLRTKAWYKITDVFMRFCGHLGLKKATKTIPAASAVARVLLVGQAVPGETAGLVVDGKKYAYRFRDGDSLAALVSFLKEQLQDMEVVSGVGYILLRAKPGAAGNDISLQPFSSEHLNVIVALPFSAGMDAYDVAVTRLCDMRAEQQQVQLVHLQTRPFKIGGYGFKTLYHTLLRGEFFPAGDKYYGVYLFGSNDLVNWEIVAAKQFRDYRPHILLDRLRKSFRYFILSTGGEVLAGHTVSHAELEEAGKYGDRAR